MAIRKIVVLGAGTMGAQVAAHAAGAGLDVALLDLVPDGAEDRSVLARKALENLKRLKPSPLHLPSDLLRIRPGNFEDDWSELKDADWVFEAVIEDLDVKRALFARVAPVLRKTAVVTTNTSGLGIAAMSQHLPFRERFLGTHFFNPPRYLKLLETIAGPDTRPEVVAEISAFCDRVMGKGVVPCKDTPNFIGNRIGSYSLGAVLRAMMDLDLTIEEVDVLTGPAIGRARSATFRTCDLAGVDVCVKVAENLYTAVPLDPQREIFKMPAFMHSMLERGWLGEKTGGGFYRKEDGNIRALDWKTLEYRERQKPKFPSVEAAQRTADIGARIAQLLAGQDKASQFLSRVLTGTSFYAASLVPEISEDVVSVDRAMEWGYGWGLGPFRLMDAVGVPTIVAAGRSQDLLVPRLVEQLLASGRQRFYDEVEGRPTQFGPTGVVPVLERPGVIEVAALKRRGAVRKKNAGASLVDLGDGVGLVEFHSKMNSLGGDAVSMLSQAAKDAQGSFDALVIGNQGEQFSVGANLMMVLLAAQEGEWDELDLGIRQLQNACMGLKYADVPVVVAPFGLTLGGGCEITLHGQRVCLSAETYMGLVEAGVGLIPAGGGTKEMTLRAHDRGAGVEGADPFPHVKRAFDLIAFAKVSTSGKEARQMFLNPTDVVCRHPDRVIADAKEIALGLHRSGHRAGSPRTDVPVLGRPALAIFKMGIHNARRGDQISEHDALVALKAATVLCGGDREPGTASEQHYLDLEREAFLSLLGTTKTQARVQYMLKEGKPLRN